MNFLAMGLGFAMAGAFVSLDQALSARQTSFALLYQPQKAFAAVSVPFLVIAAPFLIMRNTLMDRRAHPRRFAFVMMATLISGFWSLMSGTALVVLLRGIGLLA